MKLLAIIEDTIREGIARKTIIGFFILSTLFLLIGIIAAISIDTESMFQAQQIPDEQGKMITVEMTKLIQSGIVGTINFFAIIISVFATASIIPHTVEKGAIDLLLSKPVSRLTYLTGKSIGAVLIVLANVAYFVIGMWLILSIKTGSWEPGILVSILTITYSFAVLYTVLLLIGVTSGSTPLSIITVYVYLFLINPIIEAREIIAQATKNDTVKYVLDGLYYILPKPGELRDIAVNVIFSRPIDWEPVFTSLAFGAALFALSAYIFQKKDF